MFLLLLVGKPHKIVHNSLNMHNISNFNIYILNIPKQLFVSYVNQSDLFRFNPTYSVTSVPIRFNLNLFSSIGTHPVQYELVHFNLNVFSSIGTHPVQSEHIQFISNSSGSIQTYPVQSELIRFNQNLSSSL